MPFFCNCYILYIVCYVLLIMKHFFQDTSLSHSVTSSLFFDGVCTAAEQHHITQQLPIWVSFLSAAVCLLSLLSSGTSPTDRELTAAGSFHEIAAGYMLTVAEFENALIHFTQFILSSLLFKSTVKATTTVWKQILFSVFVF